MFIYHVINLVRFRPLVSSHHLRVLITVSSVFKAFTGSFGSVLCMHLSRVNVRLKWWLSLCTIFNLRCPALGLSHACVTQVLVSDLSCGLNLSLVQFLKLLYEVLVSLHAQLLDELMSYGDSYAKVLWEKPEWCTAAFPLSGSPSSLYAFVYLLESSSSCFTYFV